VERKRNGAILSCIIHSDYWRCVGGLAWLVVFAGIVKLMKKIPLATPAPQRTADRGKVKVRGKCSFHHIRDYIRLMETASLPQQVVYAAPDRLLLPSTTSYFRSPMEAVAHYTTFVITFAGIRKK